jgi:hypothetical protein
MGGGGSSRAALDLAVDFEAATPADDDEQQLAAAVEGRVLNPARELLPRFAAYQDCQTLIAVAISNASPENVDAAWAGALPNVQFQAELFDFGSVVIEHVQRIVASVVSHGGSASLGRRIVTTKLLILCFDVILRFDDTLTTLPRLLGDLSFFRRNASRHSDCDALFAKSNEMSMFFAVPSPLLMKAIAAVSGAARQPAEASKVLDVFGGVVHLCTGLQTKHKSANEEENVRQYRAIVAALLCHDHIAPLGVFHPKSGVKVLPAVNVLAHAQPKASNLLNLLKYSSKHYKDPTTVKGVTAVIG